MRNFGTAILFALVFMSSTLMGAVMSNQDARAKEQWVQNRVDSSDSTPVPFSFEYNGAPAAQLLQSWPRNTKTRKLDSARTEHTITWSDPQTRLEVRYSAVEYSDFPVVEWTVHFKNKGSADTPILSNIQAIDVISQHQVSEDLRLHYIDGDGIASAYAPRLKSLDPGSAVQFAPGGGRPTSGAFPYYNLEWSGQGVIIAVG